MATTTPDNLKTPDAGDQYALVQDLGALADTTQSALVRRANSYVGTYQDRAAFTSAPEGTSWQDTNGLKGAYVRQDGSWVGDTGWVSCTMEPSLTGQVDVRKKNGVVHFRGQVSRSSNFPTTSAGVKVFSLPGPAYRPPSFTRVVVGAFGSSSANSTVASLSATVNDVTVFGTGVSVDTAWFAHVSYLTD